MVEIMKTVGLRPKQAKFVEEYLCSLNATDAARKAGYSKRSAEIIGFENLRKPKIIAALQERREELAKHVQVTPESVAEEYARLAFADMATYVTWGPDGVTLKGSDELPKGASAAVIEVTETITGQGSTIRFKLHDKKGALDSLAKHLGMFVERHEHVGDVLITVKYEGQGDPANGTGGSKVIEGKGEVLGFEQGPEE